MCTSGWNIMSSKPLQIIDSSVSPIFFPPTPDFFGAFEPSAWGVLDYLDYSFQQAYRTKTQFQLQNVLAYYKKSLKAVIEDLPGSEKATCARILLGKYKMGVRPVYCVLRFHSSTPRDPLSQVTVASLQLNYANSFPRFRENLPIKRAPTLTTRNERTTRNEGATLGLERERESPENSERRISRYTTIMGQWLDPLPAQLLTYTSWVSPPGSGVVAVVVRGRSKEIMPGLLYQRVVWRFQRLIDAQR